MTENDSSPLLQAGEEHKSDNEKYSQVGSEKNFKRFTAEIE